MAPPHVFHRIAGMPWRAHFDPATRVVHLAYTGRLSASALSEAFEAGAALIVEHGSLWVLADCTGLEGGHTVADLYFLAETMGRAPLPRGFREAVLLPALAEPARNAAFWETTAANQGFEVQLFSDRDEAMRWLTR